MARQKQTKLPFDKTNDIKQTLLYIAIVDQGNGNAVCEIFKRAGSSVCFVQIGEGTASKTVLDIMGVENNSKEIVYCLIKKENLEEALIELQTFYAASKRNRGIGFSINLTSVVGVRIYRFLTNMF